MYHGFDRELAVEIGLSSAIVFRIIAGKISTKVEHHGDGAIELSIDNVLEVAPYLTRYQVSRSINQLIEHGFISKLNSSNGRHRVFDLTSYGLNVWTNTRKMESSDAKSNPSDAKSNPSDAKSNPSDAKSNFPSSIDQLDQNKNITAHAHANNSISFAMQEDWRPRSDFLDRARLAGASTSSQRLEQLLVQYRLASVSSQTKTQAQWESTLITWIRNDNRQSASRITSAPPRSKYQQSRSAMEGFLND